MNKKETSVRASFAGLEHESPAEFLEDMEQWFARNQIWDERERIYQTGLRLSGAAAQWYQMQKVYLRTFWEFADKLMKKFDGFDKQIELRMELMTRAQKDGESVESFILKKRALFHRLHPEGDEGDLIKIRH